MLCPIAVAVHLSAYDIGEYKAAAPDMSPSYFRQVILATKTTKPLILPLLKYLVTNEVTYQTFNDEPKSLFMAKVSPKAAP